MFNKAAVETYFNAEKQASLFFMGIGLVAAIVALLLFFYFKNTWGRGAALPVLIIGLLQIVMGYTVYNRSDDQRKDIVYKMDLDPGAIKSKEIPRMQQVMRQFVMFRYAEIGFLLMGLVLYFLFKNQPDKQWWTGFGIGLLIQAGILLVADGIAERRGRLYLDGLQSSVGNAAER